MYTLSDRGIPITRENQGWESAGPDLSLFVFKTIGISRVCHGEDDQEERLHPDSHNDRASLCLTIHLIASRLGSSNSRTSTYPLLDSKPEREDDWIVIVQKVIFDALRGIRQRIDKPSGGCKISPRNHLWQHTDHRGFERNHGWKNKRLGSLSNVRQVWQQEPDPSSDGDMVIYLRKFAVGISFSANCGWRLGIIFTSTRLFTPNEMSPEDLTSTLQLCYEDIWGAPDIPMGGTSEESVLKAGRIALSTRPSVCCMVLMCMPCIAKVSLICRVVTAPATNPSSRLPLTAILSQIYLAPFSGAKYTFTKICALWFQQTDFFPTVLYRFSFVPSTDSHSRIVFVVKRSYRHEGWYFRWRCCADRRQPSTVGAACLIDTPLCRGSFTCTSLLVVSVSIP
ncbi:hypothetical protein ARMGADRAFT_1088862 [Armillaria gallica]|uniref:Uncharacterized protein n=1 Tax=Armillaria gallica TaxID=47427 RepID=A0A2H3CLA8_ARMGA|nr:hypothetical protein ARMGADRAFT_1088862 [Armillaria gallica]